MRIVCISDTHSMHDRLDLPDGDVLIHAGDFTRYGQEDDIVAFNEWIGDQPHPHKIVVAGNHDFMFEREPSRAVVMLTACTYLEDEAIAIDGVNFYGSPWQPEFGTWAFNLPRGQPIDEKWAKIPGDTNVLITHGPPWGVRDLCPNAFGDGNVNVGCEDLGRRVSELKDLRLHVFGHIHEGYGCTNWCDSVFVNASTCTKSYKPTNRPIVISI